MGEKIQGNVTVFTADTLSPSYHVSGAWHAQGRRYCWDYNTSLVRLLCLAHISVAFYRAEAWVPLAHSR